jgi:hypothetical protein
MSSSIPLLMIAYHFPPANEIGAARPFRFYKYAALAGLDPVVVTAALQTTPAGNVHAIADPFVERPRSFSWHGERLLRRFLIPGETGTAWSLLAARFCRDFVDQATGPVVLYSTFPPLGTHLAAIQTVLKSPVCWIADFRDPYVSEKSRRLSGLRRAVACRVERVWVKRATAVVVNTNAAGEEWLRRYPELEGRVSVLPNGYDPAVQRTAPPLPPDAPRVLIHTGSLYAGRSMASLVAAAARLIASGRLDPFAFRLQQLGYCDPGTLGPESTVRSAVEAGWLCFESDRVVHAEAIARAQAATGLVLVQPQSTTQVPGKLFEYVRIGRPVLACLQRDSAAEAILRESGIPCEIVYPDDDESVVESRLLRFLTIAPGPWPPSDSFRHTYNAVEQIKTLRTIIDNALIRHARARR